MKFKYIFFTKAYCIDSIDYSSLYLMGSEGNVLGKLSDLSQKYLLAEYQTKNKMTFGENSIINASKNDIKLIFNHFFLGFEPSQIPNFVKNTHLISVSLLLEWFLEPSCFKH